MSARPGRAPSPTPAFSRFPTCSSICRTVTRTAAACARSPTPRPALEATFRGRLAGVRRVHTRRRGFSVVRGQLSDGTGTIPVVWFNRPYLARPALEEGEWLLYGAVREGAQGIELLNPTCERASEEGAEDTAVHSARIVPVYPAAGSIGPAALRRLLGTILEELDPSRQVAERVPAEMLDRHGLPPLGAALRTLHAPAAEEDVDLLNRRRSPAPPAADLR